MVILDVSGCIGSNFYDGNYADIIVCSFGKWKPINLGYGGFISMNFFEENYLKFDKSHYRALYEKLVNLKNRYQFYEKINKKIKNELKQFSILHKDSKGINVIVEFKDEEEKNNIISYCEKNKYEFVECPKMIRVNRDAISIEVKRLE